MMESEAQTTYFKLGKAKASTRPCPRDPEGCVVLCDPDDICTFIMPASLAQRLKVGFFFGLWFRLSISYSVSYSILNKRLTNMHTAGTSLRDSWPRQREC